jgi:hypothetical protein
MSTTTQIIDRLKTQRSQAERELEKLNLAIKALTAIEGTAPEPVRRKPKFTKAGLARIAAAQKRRWRALKAAAKK